ncbi:MAG: TlpA disulfide reductase family protein [Chloroflexi bacterium]|nr:TlpA disulfide reductase family protein [Chloroflexota bacterium]
MYGVLIGIAVAIIAVVLLLAFVLPPTVSVDPPSVDKGTDININGFLFSPGEKITATILRASDNIPIANYDYAANTFGILSDNLSTATFDVGEYKVVITSRRGEIARKFSIRGKTSPIKTVTLPDGITPPPNPLIIEPLSGRTGTIFKITATSLRPHWKVLVKVEACNNKICTDNRTIYIRQGEQESTNADGTLVFNLTSDRNWLDLNYVSVDDGLTTLSGYIPIIADNVCSCTGNSECGQVGCCAPNFTLASLSGDSITLCNEYNKGLSPQPVIWINFWNTSCPGCIEYMKIIQHIKDTWNKGELKVFTINVGEDPATVAKFLSDRGYSFFNDPSYPVLFDTDKSVKGRYQPGGDPCHYFVDQKGIIRVAKFGYGSIRTEAEVRAVINEIIRR